MSLGRQNDLVDDPYLRYHLFMIALANFAMIFLLSLVGAGKKLPDPHGLYMFSRDPILREMLVEGRFGEFEAAVDGFVGMKLSIELSTSRRSKVDPQTVRDAMKASADLTSLLETLEGAVKVACFAAELQAAGPSKAALMAVSWVESGIVRKSGLKPPAFPSFFSLLEGGDPRALEGDLRGAHSLMDSSYARILGRLGETLL